MKSKLFVSAVVFLVAMLMVTPVLALGFSTLGTQGGALAMVTAYSRWSYVDPDVGFLDYEIRVSTKMLADGSASGWASVLMLRNKSTMENAKIDINCIHLVDTWAGPVAIVSGPARPNSTGAAYYVITMLDATSGANSVDYGGSNVPVDCNVDYFPPFYNQDYTRVDIKFSK